MALAVLAGLLLGMAHPPAQPGTPVIAAQTATLELGGGTFGPPDHVLAEDFRLPQQRPTDNPPPGGDGQPPLPSAVIPIARMPAKARLAAFPPHPPAGRTPDRHRPTGPPQLRS